MKKLLPCLTASFLLSAIVAAHATLIVYGVINGVVVDTSGPVATTVGDSVSGTFSYDFDLLSAPNPSGNRTVSFYDPYASFEIRSSAGESGGGGNTSSGGGNLELIVDANGLPYSGSVSAETDLGIDPSFVGVSYQEYVDNQPVGWGADVTYTITGVPDASATWLLLGVGMASVTVARRFFRQIRA